MPWRQCPCFRWGSDWSRRSQGWVQLPSGRTFASRCTSALQPAPCGSHQVHCERPKQVLRAENIPSGPETEGRSTRQLKDQGREGSDKETGRDIARDREVWKGKAINEEKDKMRKKSKMDVTGRDPQQKTNGNAESFQKSRILYLLES